MDIYDEIAAFVRKFKGELDERDARRSVVSQDTTGEIVVRESRFESRILTRPQEDIIVPKLRTECPVVSLVCDSISASKSKCGWVEFVPSTPPNYYCHRQSVTEYLKDGSTCCVKTDQDDFGFGAPTICGVCGTLSTTNNTCPGSCSPCEYACDPNHLSSSSATVAVYTCSDTDRSGHTCSQRLTITYSSEYTTSMLQADVVADLPVYSDNYGGGSHPLSGQGTTCSATRSLSTDETSYSIRRFKYKFTFAAAPCDFVIQWTERFTPAGGGSPTDTVSSETITAGSTESSVYTRDEPTSNGTTTIVDISTYPSTGSPGDDCVCPD